MGMIRQAVLEDYLQQIMKYLGFSMIIFGLLGVITVIFSVFRLEKIYQIGLGFIYIYLMLLGFLISFYNDKLIVRGYRT
ncbi:MAG: hypothetical protein V1678_00720 [Candidatus Aenigmatarchaeota archaeon]